MIVIRVRPVAFEGRFDGIRIEWSRGLATENSEGYPPKVPFFTLHSKDPSFELHSTRPDMLGWRASVLSKCQYICMKILA